MYIKCSYWFIWDYCSKSKNFRRIDYNHTNLLPLLTRISNSPCIVRVWKLFSPPLYNYKVGGHAIVRRTRKCFFFGQPRETVRVERPSRGNDSMADGCRRLSKGHSYTSRRPHNNNIFIISRWRWFSDIGDRVLLYFCDRRRLATNRKSVARRTASGCTYVKR